MYEPNTWRWLLEYAYLLARSDDEQYGSASYAPVHAGYFAALALEKLKEELHRELSDMWRLRNEVIHSKDMGAQRENTEKLVDMLVKYVEEQKQKLYADFEKNMKLLDDEDLMRYHLILNKPRPSSGEKLNIFAGIFEEDFEDMFRMNERMVALCRDETVKNFAESNNLSLHVDRRIIRAIAGVWLAAVPKSGKPDESGKIDKPSLAIAITPVYALVSILFGGRSHNYRKCYYRKLAESPMELLGRLCGDSFYLYKKRWYYYIVDEMRIEKDAEEKIKKKAGQASDRLEESGKTITWGMLLPGKKFTRDKVVEKGKGFAEEVVCIWEKLLPILRRV